MIDDEDETRSNRSDPRLIHRHKQTLGQFQQLTWAPALDAAPRPVTDGVNLNRHLYTHIANVP